MIDNPCTHLGDSELQSVWKMTQSEEVSLLKPENRKEVLQLDIQQALCRENG
jgi:hypothetical protein